MRQFGADITMSHHDRLRQRATEAAEALKHRGPCAIVFLALLIGLIGAIVIGSPFPWGPVTEQDAVCIAAARTPEGAVVHWAEAEPGAPLVFRDEAHEDKQEELRLRPDELVKATAAQGWSSTGWCEIEAVEQDVGDARIDLIGPWFYAATGSLTALSARDIVRLADPAADRSGAAAINLTDGFAMEYLDVSDIALTGEEHPETVVWQRWVRAPGTIGLSVYRCEEGVPHWLFAKLLWATLWCDPYLEVLAKGPDRPQAQIVAFEPPLWFMTYTWDGQRFANTGFTTAGVLQLPRAVFWSYRRWLIALCLILVLSAVARLILRRGRSRREG